MKTRRKRIRDVMCAAALLLALAAPPAAYGQTTTDNFFNVNDDGHRGGSTGGTGSWLGFGENTGGEATWSGFEDGGETPLGGGLLALTAAGACYAGIKRFRNSKIRQSKA